jgi:hypothetical protein
MANCGNFLEYAGSKCGLDVGYGKMLLVYKDKTQKSAADLTATAISFPIRVKVFAIIPQRFIFRAFRNSNARPIFQF